MQSFIVPFGNRGWNYRRELVHEIVSMRSAAPFLYDDCMVLVPASRLKRLYARLFLDALQRLHGSSALVQPSVITLPQFLQEQFVRLRGPRLIDENSRLVLLEGLVKEFLARNRLFDQNPELLAPSLSSVLAKTIEQLSAAAIGPDDLRRSLEGTDCFDKPQVTTLLTLYDRYRNALSAAGLVDVAGMKSFVLDRFDPAWLAPFRRIVIDGVLPADRLDGAILNKILSCGDCTFLVDAPSPEVLAGAAPSHPLGPVKEFIDAIGTVPRPSAVQTGRDDLYVASVLFTDRPFREAGDPPGEFKKEVSLITAKNAREEVTLIAGEVKASLKKGIPPDAVLVAFPALDDYGLLVEEIFRDHGIPYNRALGRQLSSSAVAAAIISLLRCLQEEYAAPALVRVLSSPFLKFGGNRAIAAGMDRFMREQRLVGGREKLLSALAKEPVDPSEPDLLTRSFRDLVEALEPFSGPEAVPLSQWMERLSHLLSWCGVEERVDRIKGSLNINVQAWKKLRETFLSLAHAGRTFPAYQYTFNEWLFLLKKTLMHARFQVPPEDEGGVQVLGLEESLNHAWNEIYLGGLIDAKFPQRLPQNIFLPEHILENMGVRTLERSRRAAAYHFYRLLLSADKVVLTCPENEGDRPVVPSPFLQELAPLRNAGILNRTMARTSGVHFGFAIDQCRSVPQLAKAVGKLVQGGSLGGHLPGSLDWLDRLAKALPGQSSEIAAIRKAAQCGPGTPPQLQGDQGRREFSVTELDAYLRCPYDYYVTQVLRIRPLEEASEDLSPGDRGSKVHAVLRNFYLSWTGPVTDQNRQAAKGLLEKLGEAAFAREPDTFRNRREKDRFLSVMAGRFLDAEVLFWGQGMRPACLEQKIEDFALTLAKGEAVLLHAKIDRIDVDGNGNFLIVDYKTGKYPSPVDRGEQKIFQLPLYAVMAARSLSGSVPEIREPAGLVYYDLAGKTGGGARDVVLYNKEIRADHPSAKPKASPKSGAEFAAILEQALEKARTAVEGIRSGRYPAEPQDGNHCSYCANAVLCGRMNE